MELNGENKKSIVRRQSILIPVIIIGIISCALLSFGGYFLYSKLSYRIHNKPSITKLNDLWLKYDYQGVYDTCTVLMEKKYFNNTILTYRGYSAFYLAVSELDTSLAQGYINESIRALRIALMNSKEKTIPQIKYMLGKAYFYKDIICSYHYYADLVVRYLEEAKALHFNADDINEYLGLSYAQLGDTTESIAHFSEVLRIRDSDSLLLSIAEQYYKKGQKTAAKQYLYRITQKADDDNLILKSRTLLGKIYVDENNIDDAEKEFNAILEKDSNSADAHFGLGLIYEKRGDMVKARAEWRKTLKIDVNYEEALKKMYK